MAMEKTQLIFIPPPLIGHIFPFVQLAKLLTSMNQQLSATLLLMKLPFDDKVAKYTNSLPSISTPRLKFVEIDLPEESYLPFLSRKTFRFDYVEAHKMKVRDFLDEHSGFSSSGIVVDMFTAVLIDVANELGLASYVFYTTGAAQLGLKLHVQSLRDDFNIDVTEYKNLDIELDVTTYMNPVSSKLLPSMIYDKEGVSHVFLDLTKRLREAKGIIVNTFLELESHALQALSDDKNIPKVYTAGPLLNLASREDNNQEAEAFKQWLDRQPDFSVVFLCFGSQGWFGVEQVKEIAVAIEHSGHRFIWSLRKPVGNDSKRDLPDKYENLNEILPQGFLERTAGIGHVIGWAPQMAVLSHPAVGGFVSHCGWNSTLESVWCGVPIAAWPIYAEQNTNALLIVKDLGIGVEIKMDYRNDARMKSTEIVSADLIEDRIRSLMDPENEIRKKVKKLKEESRLVLKEGGSSFASLTSFLTMIMN